MLSNVIASHVLASARCVPLSYIVRSFAAAEDNDRKTKHKYIGTQKIPIDRKDYSLKHKCADAANAKRGGKSDKKKPISLYAKGKVVEYEWVDPGPDDTDLNPDYDKVDAPNKANYVYKEYGFKLKGPEPTRYFDWERKGRVSDF